MKITINRKELIKGAFSYLVQNELFVSATILANKVKKGKEYISLGGTLHDQQIKIAIQTILGSEDLFNYMDYNGYLIPRFYFEGCNIETTEGIYNRYIRN